MQKVAGHCWVHNGSTALVSLTAPARQGSAAQLELGNPGSNPDAAKLELQVAFLGPGGSIYLNPYVPVRLTPATVTQDRIGSGQSSSENLSRAQVIWALKCEKLHAPGSMHTGASALFFSAYLLIFIPLFYKLFYSIIILISDFS